MASTRRTPELTDSSPVSLSRPISPVAAVCVPPQSSVEKPSDSFTTRTLSPYFSPKSAMAWYSFTATSMGTSSSVSTLALASTSRLTMFSISSSSSSATCAKCEKSKRSRSGATERAGLLDVRAQHLPQRGVEQVRAGVVAADGVAALAVDDGVDVVADGEVALEHGLVRAHALHGKHAAGDFGDGRRCRRPR